MKLAYILFLGGGLFAFPTEGTDAGFYDKAAHGILQSWDFGKVTGDYTAEVPPGEAYLLALLYGMSGRSLAFAKIVHAALLTAVAVLIYLTGQELNQPVAGFWSGILTAVDPAQAYLAGTFLAEPLYMFLVVLGMYWLLIYRNHAKSRLLVSVGLCFGLASLTKNQAWLFSLALFAGGVLTQERVISRRASLVVLVATLLTIVPWTLRNYAVTNQFILVSTNGGLTLWSSNNPDFVWRQPMPMSLPIYNAPPGLSQSELDNFYQQRALEWIQANPLNFLANGLRKLIMLYNFDPSPANSATTLLYRLAGLIPYGIMLPFIALGFFLNMRKREYALMVWWVLFNTLLAFLFWGDSRVRAPIQPYLYFLGILGLQTVVARLSHRFSSKTIGESGEVEAA